MELKFTFYKIWNTFIFNAGDDDDDYHDGDPGDCDKRHLNSITQG